LTCTLRRQWSTVSRWSCREPLARARAPIHAAKEAKKTATATAIPDNESPWFDTLIDVFLLPGYQAAGGREPRNSPTRALQG
jgi:hypothetical protein